MAFQVMVCNVISREVYSLILDEKEHCPMADFKDKIHLGKPHKKAQPEHMHSMLPNRIRSQAEKIDNGFMPSFDPVIKSSWGRYNESTVGNFNYDGLLPDYDDNRVSLDFSKVDMGSFGMLSLGDVMKQLDVTRYVVQALALLKSGSDEKAISHVIADILVSDFKADNLPFSVPLPDRGNGRSRDGSLTDGERTRAAAYKKAILTLQAMGTKIVEMAKRQGEPILQSQETG